MDLFLCCDPPGCFDPAGVSARAALGSWPVFSVDEAVSGREVLDSLFLKALSSFPIKIH
jgi:hypothetical protein